MASDTRVPYKPPLEVLQRNVFVSVIFKPWLFHTKQKLQGYKLFTIYHCRIFHEVYFIAKNYPRIFHILETFSSFTKLGANSNTLICILREGKTEMFILTSSVMQSNKSATLCYKKDHVHSFLKRDYTIAKNNLKILKISVTVTVTFVFP